MAKEIIKTLAERDLEDFELVFSALAHESRRNILVVLQSRGGTMTAGDIVKRFSFAWPTITRHLQQLEQAGLLKVDKISREQYYTINKDRLMTVTKWLKFFNLS